MTVLFFKKHVVLKSEPKDDTQIQRLARGVYARETERDASMPQRDADVCGQGQAVDPTGAQLELYQYSTEQHQSQEAGRAEFSQLPKAALSRTLC